MGKGARNRAIRDFAIDVALGRGERARPIARQLRRRANRARRATPIPTNRMRYLEHVARTQPPEHRR